MSRLAVDLEWDFVASGSISRAVYASTIVIHPGVEITLQNSILQVTGVQNAGVLQVENANWTGISKEADGTSIAVSQTPGIHGFVEDGTLLRGKILRSKINFEPEETVEITDHTLDLEWSGTEPTFRNVTFINRPTIQKSSSVNENCVCNEGLVTESLSNLTNATNLKISGPLSSASNSFISFN